MEVGIRRRRILMSQGWGWEQVSWLNRAVWVDLIEKVKSERKLEGDEDVKNKVYASGNVK